MANPLAAVGTMFGALYYKLNPPPVVFHKPDPVFPPQPASFKGFVFEGSTYPYDPFQISAITLNRWMRDEYIPAMGKVIGDRAKGLKLLVTAMAHVEGFMPGSRSYRTKNPGNIGNTDSGANKPAKTLEEGIMRQVNYVNRIVEGKNPNYPIGKLKYLPPVYSQEIANNPKTYGVSGGWVPGYRFIFTGQLDQFVKIYATFPRISNNYIDTVVSYFRQNGIVITPESRLQDIIQLT